MNIEPLEARIAPAAVITFTDVDGDHVTISVSKGTLAQLQTAAGDLTDHQLQTLDLSTTADFDGASIAITAAPQTGKGDGFVNVGYINATNRVLGAVSVDGDLGAIDAGKTTVNAFAVQSLTVHSLGELGTTTGAPADLRSDLAGSVKSITVKGDVRDALVDITGSAGTPAVNSSLGALTIGGSLLGTTATGLGSFNVVGNIGPIKIGGSVISGPAQGSGQILSSAGSLGTVTIGGDILGGPLGFSGYIFAKTTMGAVSIGGDLRGGGAAGGGNGNSGYISTGSGGIASVKIGGSIIGGAGDLGGAILASNDMNTHRPLGPVTVGGSVIGGAGNNSGLIASTGNIGLVKIGGDLRGGGGGESGYIAGTDVAGVVVSGSIFGGSGTDSGLVDSVGKITFVKIGGNVEGGVGSRSGRIISHHHLGTITIGGSLIGNGPNSGTIVLDDAGDEMQTVGAITIGGSIVGGGGFNSGSIQSFNPDVHDFFGAIKVVGDLRGGSGDKSGSIIVGNVTGITFGGSVVGGSNNFSGYISALAVSTVTIGHDVRGGDAGASNLDGNGYLEFVSLGSLKIGGSIFAGHKNGAGTLTHSGALYASQGFGAVNIKGSLVGQPANLVTIYAGSRAGDPVENNVVLKSLTIGGQVENAWIFGGVLENGAAFNGNTQIGAVKVGGDWLASSLGSGVTSTDGVIGDGNDSVFGTGTRSKIASIVIGGAVLGRAGTTETFGFFAREIGSFKYHGIAVALLAGAGNDAFFVGLPSKAQPLGPSLSPATGLKPDPFAVHVYEV